MNLNTRSCSTNKHEVVNSAFSIRFLFRILTEIVGVVSGMTVYGDIIISLFNQWNRLYNKCTITSKYALRNMLTFSNCRIATGIYLLVSLTTVLKKILVNKKEVFIWPSRNEIIILKLVRNIFSQFQSKIFNQSV